MYIPITFLIPLSVLLIAVLVLSFLLGRTMGRLNAARKLEKTLKSERSDAIKRSRAVLTGQFSEQLAPYLPDFPASPAEVRFIGKPLDFIAFSGISTGEITEVLFIEVKTGSSSLSKTERSLRNAINSGKVKYMEYKAPLKT